MVVPSVVILVAALAQGPQLTLDEAVRQAIARSPQVAAARARVALARARTSEVWAGVYPQIALSSSLQRFDLLGGSGGLGSPGGIGGIGGVGADPTLAGAATGTGTGAGIPGSGGSGAGLGGLGGFGGLGGASSLPAGGYHQIQAGINVSQVLFDGMRTRSGLQLAELQERMGSEEVAGAERRAGFDAATLYVQTLRAEALLALAARATEHARSQVERAEIRLRAGTGMRLDLLQAQAALAGFRVQQATARNAVARARVGLGALLGGPVEVALGPASLPEAQVDLARDLPAAIAHRQDIRQLDLKIGMDRELVTQAERSAWPTAGAFGTLSWQGGGAARYDLVGLQANWPLFDAGRVRAKVEQARADLAADEATRTGLERAVEAEIRRALLDREDARERIDTAGEGLEAAREALRLAEARHQTGGGTMFDVSDANQALVRAESDRLGAEFEVTLAEIRLASALGVPLSNLGLVPGPGENAP